jgi:hypothetical protein
VNLISEESGVSTPTEHRETALKTILTSWKEGSIQQTPGEGGTVELITTAVKPINPRFVTVILNSDDPRGVRCGDILYVTRGDDWGSVAHEWGHGFADLEDEYDNPNDTYTNE